jgi:hypothetical protein
VYPLSLRTSTEARDQEHLQHSTEALRNALFLRSHCSREDDLFHQREIKTRML